MRRLRVRVLLPAGSTMAPAAIISCVYVFSLINVHSNMSCMHDEVSQRPATGTPLRFSLPNHVGRLPSRPGYMRISELSSIHDM